MIAGLIQIVAVVSVVVGMFVVCGVGGLLIGGGVAVFLIGLAVESATGGR